jgi:hypothetical protein
MAGFVISPTRGISRLISGEAWKVTRTPGRQFDIPKIKIEIASGVRNLELKDEILDEGFGLVSTAMLEYGEKFETRGFEPFDYFSVRTNLNLQKGQPVLGKINIIGRLWSIDWVDTQKDYLNFGVYQHYDYFDSDVISDISERIPYRFGSPASFGIGLMHNNLHHKNWERNSYVHLNFMLLGASLSDHYFVDERNYNLGTGFSEKMGFSTTYKEKFGISWQQEGFYIFTTKGYPKDYAFSGLDYNKGIDYQGDQSNTMLNTSTLKLDLKLYKQLYLSGEVSVFSRYTHYKYFKDVHSITYEKQLLLTYKF